jgi:hypothetical protein
MFAITGAFHSSGSNTFTVASGHPLSFRIFASRSIVLKEITFEAKGMAVLCVSALNANTIVSCFEVSYIGPFGDLGLS